MILPEVKLHSTLFSSYSCLNWEMFYMHNAYFEDAFIDSTVKDSLHIW